MASSPTSRSLAMMREQGYIVDVVERRIPFSKKTHDLFNIIDIVAVGGGETVGIQTTSYSNVSTRVKKINESPYRPILQEAGWFLVVHGWHKKKNRWVCRIVEIAADGG